MDKTLVKKSSIFQAKSKFFIYRTLTYFGFLLIPVWLPKLLTLNTLAHTVSVSFYILFMVGQWFLLGKEIDHRFKIYFKVNSSMDRLVYRMYLGMISMMIIFNIMYLIPSDIVNHFFWGFWVILGLFYSWPTRGKIIQENLTSNFGEFKFLDSFERTCLSLIVILFCVSIPKLPEFQSIEALKLYLDPSQQISNIWWNYLSINYFPFKKFNSIYKLGWCLHFYMIGMGGFLVCFYALLRFFYSRRLSLLGVLALISAWPASKFLNENISFALTSTYSVFWVWSLLWASKSSSYRSGLFLGFISFLGTVINPLYLLLIPFKLIFLHLFLLEGKTYWYKRQVNKYFAAGIVLSLITAYFANDINGYFNFDFQNFNNHFFDLLGRKAFYVVSVVGLMLMFMIPISNKNVLSQFSFMNNKRYLEFLILIGFIFVCSFVLDKKLMFFFSLMWVLVFFSLYPLECVFQTISRLRSRRNLFFGIYMLICLLDSHFEVRVKTFLQFFNIKI